MQGYLGIKSGFVRTPKFNAGTKEGEMLNSLYADSNINWLNFVEGLLILYFLFGLVQAISFKNYGTVPLLLLAVSGFSMVFGLSMQERFKKALVMS